MNRRIIHSEGSEKVKANLTVPSENCDIRLVAQSSEKPAHVINTRRGWKMARDSKSGKSSTRPARRIKLNRSIFNTDTTAKPTFHVKSLSEIKREKEAVKDAAKDAAIPTEGLTPAKASVIEDNVSSCSPMPARSVAYQRPSTDTRTVIKRDNNKGLLVPKIQLYRECYAGSVINKNIKSSQNTRRVISKETGTEPTVFSIVPRQPALTHHAQESPVKKRKVSPVCLVISKPQLKSSNASSPIKKRKISPIGSPVSESQSRAVVNESPTISLQSSPVPPSPPLESPPSPALSLDVYSDHELDTSTEENTNGSSRVVLMTNSTNEHTNFETGQKKKSKSVQNNTERDVHSRLGPPPCTQKNNIWQDNELLPNFDDDKLDVISVIAEDDELFLEDTPNGRLKRSRSQDSIFSSTDESNSRGNLRSLAKKTQGASKLLIGDIITSKPLSRNFKIPRQNSTGRESSRQTTVESTSKRPVESYRSAGRRGSDTRNDFFHGQNMSHQPPKPSRVVSNTGQPINGFSVQEKVRVIQRNLGCKNIRDAWLVIKELVNMKSVIDVRMLEEAVKVCEQLSNSTKEATPELAATASGVFGILKHRDALKPMAYILTILTLCRCGNFEEGFNYMTEMIEARTFPQQEFLVHFINDLLKCLRATPKWIFQLLQNIQMFNFSNATHVFNNCLPLLAAAPVSSLREIPVIEWNALIDTICAQSNTQGATLVHNLIEKHRIILSDQATTKLLSLFQETKCIKQLLDLVHLRCTNQTFDVATIFADESVNLRDVEAHIADLVNVGILPREDIVHHFVEAASSMKEFNLIYGLFLKYECSTLSLSIATLQQMIKALENWNENVNASVEVYSTMRQAKMAANGPTAAAARPLNLPQKHFPKKHQCFTFMKTGRCHHGEKCWFSHVVGETPQLCRQNSDSRKSIGEVRKPEQVDGKQQLNHNAQIQTQSEFPNTSMNTTLVNGFGHNHQPFPSFQPPSFVMPMFNSAVQDHTAALSVPQPARRPQAKPTRHPFPQGKSVHPTPRFMHPIGQLRVPPVNKPSPLFRPLVPPNAPNTDMVKLNRSFSWEPGNNPRPKLRISPLMQFQQASPGSDKNNNKAISEFQQRLERAITSKDWQEVYLCYVESKEANNKAVQSSDLKIFRSVLVRDISTVGVKFSELVGFIYKEKSSVKSSHSDSANPDVFDQYDVEFIGTLGVSLMEKCLVTKKFDKGYEILHALHAHNVTYFECGKNFGAYTRDIPPSAVAIIAVKLCMGMSQEDGLIGAVEVLRASNYAIHDDGVSSDNEYRTKVLQQVFTQLFDQGNISEANEILEHLNASPSVMLPLCVKVLTHYTSLEDFDQSFDVLTEMQGHGLDLNIPACRSLYEKFLKRCLTNGQDDEALTALQEMEWRKITLDGEVWKEIVQQERSTTNEILTNKLFEKCINLGVYPVTFCKNTPWLCQLGCGYTRNEVKLLIVRHLKALNEHLSNLSLSTMNDFHIALFPRVSESNMNRKADEGIQTAIHKNGLIVAKVLQEDLNPPLTISDQKREQFHSKFIIDAMSVYRWFNANNNEDVDDDGENDDDDSSSKASIESCVSYMTRMTEFD